MENYPENQFLFLTVIDVDKALSSWVSRLKSDHYLEFGDDPNIVKEIREDIQKIDHSVRKLDPYFDLSKVPLRRANSYFSTIKKIGDTLKFVQSIQINAYGSQKNTLECLDHIQSCVDSVRQMGDLSHYDRAIQH